MDPSHNPSDTSDAAAAVIDNIPATLSHGGRFIRYDILGRIFQLTAKYKALNIKSIMPIGEDGYCILCCALNLETNEYVMIKKMKDVLFIPIEAKTTLLEIMLLRHMDHENVVAIRDIIPPPERTEFNDVYIAYEFMDTDLHQIIQSTQPLSEVHFQYFLYQILRGLKYIHSANVLHMDLKPRNILVNKDCDLKICGFGLAGMTADLRSQQLVKEWYHAPELLLEFPNKYTAAVDIWSVGCIFMELMNRSPLFPGRNPLHQLILFLELIGTPSEAELGFLSEDAKQVVRKLEHYERQSFSEKFPNVDPAAIDLIEKMLKFDHTQRITVEEALAHPYLTSWHDINDEPVCMAPFSFEFEHDAPTIKHVKEIIYKEALALNPEYQHIFKLQ